MRPRAAIMICVAPRPAVERRPRGGFTLIELLVTIGVIAMLLAILLPALGAARKESVRAACLSNMHQLGVMAELYLRDYKEAYWRYYQAEAGGRRWWFGYEAGGPGSGTHRPLDKTRSVFAPYLTTLEDHFQCPAFPYRSPDYYPKFEHRSASYGYNLTLGPVSGPAVRSLKFDRRLAEVFVFADGIHFDTAPGFNEGHYIQYAANPVLKSGYAHFRHRDQAQAVMMDGHAASQPMRGGTHQVVEGSPAGNLSDPTGGNTIYGF